MYRRLLAADIGSTTTKTVLFEIQDGAWAMKGKAVSPTTVEAPHLDVMIGLRQALSKLEALTGIRLLDGARLITPAGEGLGVDIFVASSSAGGGLQMVVTGLMKEITAESAHRAALGAGAIVSDVIALDDPRSAIEKIDAIKRLRPDMVLVTGGTDGGNISEVAAIAEMVAMANPEPRFGQDFKTPVIFAGNVEARSFVEQLFKDQMELSFADNIRPMLEKEVLGPARHKIHDIFLEHVMMHAPGYSTLFAWADGHIKPTPVAVGDALRFVAGKFDGDLLAVDVGGATTDVFSVIDSEFYRTVSANLGMSYSMGNVLAEATPAMVLRWLPFEADENIVRNWNFNKMIRPTGLPHTFQELMLEQAVCKEALRLSLEHHKSLIRGLKGVRQQRGVGDIFRQAATGDTLVDMMEIKVMIGTGGALSYAPRRSQAAMILLDGLQPEGITHLYVDSWFLLPHMGVLMDIDKDVARELIEKETLIPLGTCIAPVGPQASPGRTIARVTVGGDTYDVVSGALQVIDLEDGGQGGIEVVPHREFDVGGGPGRPVSEQLPGGVTRLILDGRGRPLELPKDVTSARRTVARWYHALGAYPSHTLKGLEV
ncbi:MAG TPA: glutamate mutase L [Bacillota bacterium]|nr:glutamate mutase L [Bacillota bacterium]